MYEVTILIMTTIATSNKRSKLRYVPFEPSHALLDTELTTPEFAPTMSALVFDESHDGCSLLFMDCTKMQVGDRLRMMFDNMPVLKAEVRWRREIAEGVAKAGVMFLD
jgi:hypothetical protein